MGNRRIIHQKNDSLKRRKYILQCTSPSTQHSSHDAMEEKIYVFMVVAALDLEQRN